MNLPPLLEVDRLTVTFHGNRDVRMILEDVSLIVRDSESVGLVGESGSGKSVLLTAIMGLLREPWRVTAGQIRFQGKDLLGLDEEALLRLRGKELALALANPRQHLNPIVTIGRQLVDMQRAHGVLGHEAAFARGVALLESVGIPDPLLRMHAYPHELSGGMCQRVILALAISNSPRLLMVDEPTNGLDVTISVQILELLHGAVKRLKSGLLIVSRDLGVVAHYCGRVAVMRQGRIVEQASVGNFFAAPRDPYSRRLLAAASAARDADLTAGSVQLLKAKPNQICPPEPATVLQIEGLVKRFTVKGGRELTAVDGVSFSVHRAEAVALVGESGSGKTTVGRCILRILEPNAGSIRFAGRDVTRLPVRKFRRLRSRVQMVFQDPFDSMNPRKRVGAAVVEPLRLTTKMVEREIRRRCDELFDLVGLSREAAHLYPHQLSAGELQRVGIARAIATNPDLVIFDEPTSSLDVSVRADILNLLRDLQQQIGITYLFISHDLTAVRRLCHRVAILYLGKVVEIGETEAIFRSPLHPYSRALLSSVLYPDPDQVRAPFVLSGEIPSPIDLPTGCALHTRCPMASDVCRTQEPAMEEKTASRWLACHAVPALAQPSPTRHDVETGSR